MTWFTVETRYIEDRERLEASRPQHRDYLRALADEGKILGGGPFADDPGGGFAVYRVADAEELERLLDADPYTVDGVAADRIVREWTVVLGRGAQ
jgi:uncharacterized protein YciI